MREIKYKGYFHETGVILPVADIQWSGKGIRHVTFYGLVTRKNKYGKPLRTSRVDGHEVTLLQFIGRTDKNGVEIYEGDIVKWGDGYTGGVSKVIWDNEDQEGAYPAFDLQPGASDELNSFAYLHYEGGELEVMGNVLTHSELLKVVA